MSSLEALVTTYLSEKDAYKIIELRNSILILVTQEKGGKFVETLENLYDKEDDPAEKQKISKLLLEVASRTENVLEVSRVLEFLSKTAKLTINFQQSVSTFKSVLERHFKKEDGTVYEIVKKLYEEIIEKNVSQYPQQCRLDFLYISNFVVESYLKGKIDHVEVERMCEAVGGEKDPRNLLKMFDLLSKLAKSVAKEEKEFECIAKTYSIYYPIQFVPPKRDKIHITPLQLKKELLKCFVSNKRLAPYSMEILIDSLYSEYNVNEKQTGVIEDTLYFLKSCKAIYTETFGEYSKNFLEVLKVELLEDNYEESNIKSESQPKPQTELDKRYESDEFGSKYELDKKDDKNDKKKESQEKDEGDLGTLNVFEVKRIGETYFKEWKYIDEKTKLLGEILKLFVGNLDGVEEEELARFLVNFRRNLYLNYSVGYIVGVLCENENLHTKVVNLVVLELLKDMLKGEESENGKHRDNILNILGIYVVPKILIHFQGKKVNGDVIKVMKKLIKKEVDKGHENKEFKLKCLKLMLLGCCIVNTKEVDKVLKVMIKSLIKETKVRDVNYEEEREQQQYKLDEDNKNNNNNANNNNNNNNKLVNYEQDDTTRTVLNVEEDEQNELGSDMGNDSTQDEENDEITEISLGNLEKIKKEIKMNMEIVIAIYKCHNKRHKYIMEYMESLLNEDFDCEVERENQKQSQKGKENKDLLEGIRRISYVYRNEKRIRVSSQVAELLRITLNRYTKQPDHHHHQQQHREEEQEELDKLESLVKRIIVLSFESLKRLINKYFSKNREYQKQEKQLEEQEYEQSQQDEYCGDNQGDELIGQNQEYLDNNQLDKRGKDDKYQEKQDEYYDDIQNFIEYANLVTDVFESKASEIAVEMLGRKRLIEYFAVLVIWYRTCLEKREDCEIKLRFLTNKVPRILSHIGEKVGSCVTCYIDPSLVFMKLYLKRNFIKECKGVHFRKYMNNIRKEDVMPLNLLNLEALFIMKGYMREFKELMKMGDMNGSILVRYVHSHYQFNFKKMVEQIKILNYYQVENVDYEDKFFFMTPISVKKVNPIIRYQLLDIRKSLKEKIVNDQNQQSTQPGEQQQQSSEEQEKEREEMLKLVISMIKGECKIGVTKNEVKGMEGENLLKVELLMSLLLILLNKGFESVEEEHLELVVESMSETLENMNKWKEQQEQDHDQQYNYGLQEQLVRFEALEEETNEQQELQKQEKADDFREYVEWCCYKYRLYVQSYMFEVISNMNNSKYEEEKRDRIKDIINKNVEELLKNVMSMYKGNQVPFSRILTILNLHSLVTSKFVKVDKEKKLKIIKKCSEFLGDPNKKVRNIAVLCRHQWINTLHD